MTLIEICVDDLAGMQAAIEGGADRIELCSALELGGLTPSVSLVKMAKAIPMEVRMMIRPRAGDFVFDDYELGSMIGDLGLARANELGVVLGASLPNGTLDVARLKILCQIAADLPKTLHRCFDLVPDIEEGIEQAIALGFDTILTSGRHLTAEAGLEDLAKMHEIAAGRIAIMAGSGVNAGNARKILKRVPLRALHASASERAREDNEAARRLGFASANRRVTSVTKVADLKAIVSAH